MNEVWKPIKGYEGIYEISNLGNVKALPRIKVNNRGYQKMKERIAKPSKQNSEYFRVSLTNNNHQRKYYSIHRLVAEAFLPNPNNLPQVNHKDGNKENNNVNNLEWCTRSYNLQHAYDNGLKPTLRKLCIEIDKLRDEIEQIKNSIKYEVE